MVVVDFPVTDIPESISFHPVLVWAPQWSVPMMNRTVPPAIVLVWTPTVVQDHRRPPHLHGPWANAVAWWANVACLANAACWPLLLRAVSADGCGPWPAGALCREYPFPMNGRAPHPGPGHGAVPSAVPSHAAVPRSDDTFRSCNNGICNTVCVPLIRLFRHGCDSVHNSAAYALMRTPNVTCHFSNPLARNPTWCRSNYLQTPFN